MSDEPRLYVLPTLRQIREGAGQGAATGVRVGLWAGPIPALSFAVWEFLFDYQSMGADAVVLYGYTAFFAAVLGVIGGSILGFFAGAAIYFVFFPIIPPERWGEMARALNAGLRRGSLVGLAGGLGGTGILIVPWVQNSVSLLGSYWVDIIYGCVAYGLLVDGLVIGGFLLGGFIGVAGLIRPTS